MTQTPLPYLRLLDALLGDREQSSLKVKFYIGKRQLKSVLGETMTCRICAYQGTPATDSVRDVAISSFRCSYEPQQSQ